MILNIMDVLLSFTKPPFVMLFSSHSFTVLLLVNVSGICWTYPQLFWKACRKKTPYRAILSDSDKCVSAITNLTHINSVRKGRNFKYQNTRKVDAKPGLSMMDIFPWFLCFNLIKTPNIFIILRALLAI